MVEARRLQAVSYVSTATFDAEARHLRHLRHLHLPLIAGLWGKCKPGRIAEEHAVQPGRCDGLRLAVPLRFSRHVHACWLRNAGDRQLPRKERIQRFDEELGQCCLLSQWESFQLLAQCILVYF